MLKKTQGVESSEYIINDPVNERVQSQVLTPTIDQVKYRIVDQRLKTFRSAHAGFYQISSLGVQSRCIGRTMLKEWLWRDLQKMHFKIFRFSYAFGFLGAVIFYNM